MTPAETAAREALRDHATTGRLPEGEGRAFIAGYLTAHHAREHAADTDCTCPCRGECTT